MEKNGKSVTGRRTDVGISIIRIAMAFAVIVDHFGDGTAVKNIRATMGKWAVPCFMFMSFYLLTPKLEKISQDFVVKRIKRLYLPLAVWTIITFTLYAILFRFGLGNVGLYDWRKIFYSLIFGSVSEFMPQFWFNIAQIIIFVFVILILYTQDDKTYFLYILYISIIGAFFLQYSGINGYLFENSSYEVRNSLGRVLEMIPFAFSGILFNYIKENERWKSLLLGVIGIAISLLGLSLQFGNEYAGFDYSGAKIYIISTLICLAVVVINYCPKGFTADAINYIASLSAGIYYMHFTVGVCLEEVMKKAGFNVDSLYFDVIIWMICVIGTIVIKRVSKKFKWMKCCIE